MENKAYEIHILNPKSTTILQFRKQLEQYGFEEVWHNKENSDWNYIKGEKSIRIALCEDYIGPYIIMFCYGISPDKIRKKMTICPECKSTNLQCSVYYYWESEEIKKLYKEGKVKYSPGAYDRHGTSSETKTCLDCGCKWFNLADILYWSEVRKQGKVLSEEILFK